MVASQTEGRKDALVFFPHTGDTLLLLRYGSTLPSPPRDGGENAGCLPAPPPVCMCHYFIYCIQEEVSIFVQRLVLNKVRPNRRPRSLISTRDLTCSVLCISFLIYCTYLLVFGSFMCPSYVFVFYKYHHHH